MSFVLIDTYWVLPKGSCDGHICNIPLSGDFALMDKFRNCFNLYEDDEKIIIKARMEEPSIQAFLIETDGLPLTTETATELNLGEYFIGKDFNDILIRFPELIGTVEDDNGIIRNRINDIKIG